MVFFPFDPGKEPRILLINITLGSHYWSLAADIQCHYLLATPAVPPPDEHLHRNGYSEKIVNSAGCVMNATLRRLFVKSQKWNSSEMWWFRGCSPTATYKERERGYHVKSLGLSATKPVMKPPFPKSWCCCDGLLLSTGGKLHSTPANQEVQHPASSLRS